MTNTPSAVSAIVVGGGPVGWLSALALTRAGYKTSLIASDEPSKDQRTVALMQGSLEFLKSLGLDPEGIEDATPLETMRLIDGTERLIRAPEVSFVASEISLPYFALNIPVPNLVKEIQKNILNFSKFKQIKTWAESVDLNPEPTITLQDGTQITADIVIGADGRRSKVREAVNISVKRWDYPQTALVTHFSHEKSHQNISTEFHTETGPFTLVPLQGRRCSVVCVVKPEEAQQLVALPDEDLSSELEKRSMYLVGKISQLGERQLFPMSSQIAEKMASGHAFLVGESGHAFPPIGAQGLNLGMRDVEELSRQLSNGVALDIPQIASSYNKSRRADVTSRTLSVDLLNRSLLTDLIPVQTARSFGLFAAKSVAPFRKIMMRHGLGAHSG